MAIQISGNTVINDNRELGTELVSAYDTVTVSAGGGTVTNRTVYCVTADGQTITLPNSPSAGNEVVIINGGAFTSTVVGRKLWIYCRLHNNGGSNGRDISCRHQSFAPVLHWNMPVYAHVE